VPQALRTVLVRHLIALAISKREFAAAVGLHPPSLHAVLAGKRPFPERLIDKAVAVLHLSGAERIEFADAAVMTHATPGIAALVQRLEREAKRS